MFYRYEIKNNGKEDVLYLYLTMTYEFSKDLDSDDEKSTILEKTKEFINNNSIDYNGSKVCLVVDGIIIKTFDINKEYVVKDVSKSNKYLNDNFIINIRYSKDKYESMTLKNYLLGIIATNKIKDLELTTLKALCVLYRTYAYKEMKKNNYIDSSNPYQIYKPISYYKMFWLENYQDNFNTIEKAIDDTDGEFVTYNDEYIYPFIHICNNGYTSKNKDYEYLDKVSSLWDYASPYYLEIKDYNYKELEKIFNEDEATIKKINITKIGESNQIEEIKIGHKTYSGEHFRALLNLKSSDVTLIINPTFLRCITKGWGNQYGLSQFGANEIAKNGGNYLSIIKYYFKDVSIKKYK